MQIELEVFATLRDRLKDQLPSGRGTLGSLDFETERVEYHDEQGVLKVNVLGRKGSGEKGLTFFGQPLLSGSFPA